MVRVLLRACRIMPVFRISEGRENLGLNDDTFDRCIDVFEQGGQVTIFSEGVCEHQTDILPLKKGTGRLVKATWEQGIAIQVIPTVINYNSFKGFGRKAIVNFGSPLRSSDFEQGLSDAVFLKQFNLKLYERMKAEVDRNFGQGINFRNPFYYLGWLINFPFYLSVSYFFQKKTAGTVFTDSLVFVTYLFGLPVYWGILYLIAF